MRRNDEPIRYPGGRRLAIAGVLLLAGPAVAGGQTVDPPPDANATMRFGPLSMRSTIALSNVGVDTNVFNQPDDEQPQSDFTMTFSPSTDVWLRMGRTWLTGAIQADWVYYDRFASERSANSQFRAGVLRTFNRVGLRASARRLSTRDRPGWEIDARAQRFEIAYDGEVEFRLLSRTTIGWRASRMRTDFEDAAFFRDASLAEELNRTTTGNSLVARHTLTPLTSLALEVGRERERFVFSPFRDSDSTRVAASVLFQPLALVSGDATIGFRHFDPDPTDVPAYRGAIAAVNLAYSLSGTTRMSVRGSRDIRYSFEVTQPYYLETGITGTVQRQVAGPVDALVRAGAQRLDYANRAGVAPLAADRVDRVRTYGIGAGYRIGSDKRLGFSIDRYQRTSAVERRTYTGLRFGLSLTYET